MPSPQSKFVSYLLRRLVKARAVNQYPVSLVRMALDASMGLFPSQRDIRIEPRNSAVRGEWLEPSRNSGRVILYLHGGGYFCCSPRTHRPLTMGLARHTNSRTFALRYRLAPEHPFPGALEDSIRAYQWLVEREGVSPRSIVLAGDSAGGGLALATLVALRDAAYPLPAGAICFSPWTDLAATGQSIDSNDGDCAMFYAETIRRSARHYLGTTDPRMPLASPLYAELAGLPPLLLHVSDSEVLRDDSTRLARRAREAGVDVQLRLFRKQPHVWQLFPLLPETRRSFDEVRAFLERCSPRAATRGGLFLPYAFP